ncbi:MAG: hypothetical protein HQL57_03860 [Magnetococcales bacterium]|nr:hypothetical protein [Magnetococcales bacterium]MBF0156304.1 hypothetical protein [Magnetococcales bacterium]
MNIKSSYRAKEPKNEVPVEVELSNGKTLKGILFVDLNIRVFDFMNLPAPFIVVVVKGRNSAKARATIVNKRHVVTLREMESPE